jgi:hypothetical protein
MDQLRKCVEVLRRLAKEPDDLDCVVLAEQAINDYLRNEIEALRAALERIGKAIDEEAAKGRGEDWSLMVGYVQACVEKLPGELEEWQKD